MKRIFIALAILATTCFPSDAVSQKLHRHDSVTVSQSTAPDDTTGIAAYSDTTSVDTAAYDEPADDEFYSERMLDKVTDPFRLIAFLTSSGIGGVLVAIFFVLLCLLVVFSPVILLAVILYFVFRRKKESYRVAEKAMETGNPIPGDLVKNRTADNDALWMKGIKTISIGVGIFVLGSFFMNKDFIAGVGALIAIYGAGQAVIARTTGKRTERGEQDDDFMADDIKDEEK